MRARRDAHAVVDLALSAACSLLNRTAKARAHASSCSSAPSTSRSSQTSARLNFSYRTPSVAMRSSGSSFPYCTSAPRVSWREPAHTQRQVRPGVHTLPHFQASLWFMSDAIRALQKESEGRALLWTAVIMDDDDEIEVFVEVIPGYITFGKASLHSRSLTT